MTPNHTVPGGGRTVLITGLMLGGVLEGIEPATASTPRF